MMGLEWSAVGRGSAKVEGGGFGSDEGKEKDFVVRGRVECFSSRGREGEGALVPGKLWEWGAKLPSPFHIFFWTKNQVCAFLASAHRCLVFGKRCSSAQNSYHLVS